MESGPQEFGVLLNTELEFLKRKFVIETKFKSKQVYRHRYK